MEIHISFTLWGWRLVPLVAGLMALASLQSPLFPRRVALGWSLSTLLLAGYAAFLEWGPRLASVDGLRAQVIAQKAATVLVALTLIYIAHEADHTRRAPTGSPPSLPSLT